METCLVCGKKTKDEIISLPSRGRSYFKRECTSRGLSYPLKYWQCEHCQATYVQRKNLNYELYEEELPYAQ